MPPGGPAVVATALLARARQAHRARLMADLEDRPPSFSKTVSKEIEVIRIIMHDESFETSSGVLAKF